MKRNSKTQHAALCSALLIGLGVTHLGLDGNLKQDPRSEPKPHTSHECQGVERLSFASREIGRPANFSFPNEANVGGKLA